MTVIEKSILTNQVVILSMLINLTCDNSAADDIKEVYINSAMRCIKLTNDLIGIDE